MKFCEKKSQVKLIRGTKLILYTYYIYIIYTTTLYTPFRLYRVLRIGNWVPNARFGMPDGVLWLFWGSCVATDCPNVP